MCKPLARLTRQKREDSVLSEVKGDILPHNSNNKDKGSEEITMSNFMPTN